MKITLNIKNESILTPLLWMLKQLESDDLEIEQDNSKLKNVKLTDEYISENWRKLIITHDYPFIEDKEKLVDAHGEWYKKYIS